MESVHKPTSETLDPDSRFLELDVLRGFALFGVLLVNMLLFAYPSVYFPPLETPGLGIINRFSEGAVRVVAEASFYTIFAALFGLGFALQIERARRSGSSSDTNASRSNKYGRMTPALKDRLNKMRRRLLVIFALGLLHGTLLWTGDILALYALAGVVLLFAYRLRNRDLLLLTATGFCVSFVLFWMHALDAQGPRAVGYISQAFSVYRDGAYAEITLLRAEEFASALVGQLIRWGPQIAALFLLGLVLGRRLLEYGTFGDTRTLNRTILIGSLIGAPIKLAYALELGLEILDPLSSAFLRALTVGFGGPALGFAYVALMLRALQHPWLRKALTPLSAVGRTAMSNYILQSVVCTYLFYGYGLGLYGEFGATTGIGLTVAIFAFQIPLSVLWLRRFRFGPLEWATRSLTYGTVQPLLRPRSNARNPSPSPRR